MAKETFDLEKMINIKGKSLSSTDIENKSKKVGRKKGEDGVLISFFIRKRLFADFDSLAKFAKKSRTQYLNDLIEKDIQLKQDILSALERLRDK